VNGQKVPVMTGEMVGGYAGAGQKHAGTGRKGAAVACGALPYPRYPKFVAGGCCEYAYAYRAMFDQSDGNSPSGTTTQIVPSTIYRIDHPDAGQIQTMDGVGCFFRQPSGSGIDEAEALAEHDVDFQVCLADGAAGLQPSAPFN
jgi:hypothetical protein